MKKIIEVKDLTYSYNEKTDALKGVSFDVYEGEYLSLVGHNGSGKSTIAKALIGLLDFKGAIKILDTELSVKTLSKVRENVAIVFQNPDNQFIGNTVRDDIAFGLENRRVPSEKMDEIILDFATKVNMQDFLEKEPTKLSGGQKQRVAIAGCLALNPSVLILDESTSMLDPKGKNEIYEVINKMRKENSALTVISITHDIEEAAKSDRVIVLESGKIVLNGKPDEVFSNNKKLNELSLTLPFFNELKEKLVEEGLASGDEESLERLVERLCQ